MNKILVSTLIICALIGTVLADEYKFKHLPDEKGTEFILPPESKLKFDKTTLKEKYAYHIVSIEGLDKNYSESKKKVDLASYRYDKDFEISGESLYTCKNPINRAENIIFAVIQIVPDKFDEKKNPISYTLKVQLNYKVLFNNCTDVETSVFDETVITLLEKLSDAEIAEKWARNISQYIVDRLFDRVPIPHESILSKFGAKRNVDSSLILLNPSFSLLVDNVAKVNWNNDGGKDWQMNLVGQSKIPFNRNSDGYVSQIPFITSTNFPHNYLLEGNKGLLASSGDLQFSSQTRTKSFFAVVNTSFRSNNSFGGEINNCYPSDSQQSPVKFTNCNFMIISSLDLRKLFQWEKCQDDYLISTTIQVQIENQKRALKKLEDEMQGNDSVAALASTIKTLQNNIVQNELLVEEIRKKEQKRKERVVSDPICSDIEMSVFGLRNLITPIFSIWINSTLRDVMVGSTISDLSIALPENIKVKRLFRGKYVKVKMPTRRFILLPGDKIDFK